MADVAGQLVIPLIERDVLDRIVDHRSGSVMPLLAVLVAVALFLAISVRVRFYYAVRIAILVLFDLRVAVHRKVLDLDRAALDEYGPGQLLERFTSDSTDAGNIFYFTSFRIQSGLPLVPGSVLVPLAVVTKISRKRLHHLFGVSRDMEGEMAAFFRDGVAGIRECQTYGHQELTRDEWQELGLRYSESRYVSARVIANTDAFINFLAIASVVIVLGVGGRLLRSGELRAGTLIAFILYVGMLFSPMIMLIGLSGSWQQTRVAIDRIAGVMSTSTRTPDASDGTPAEMLTGALALQDVGFSYSSSGPAALDHVDLTIRAGETVAVVGETGAGKSTMMKLLLRLYDPDHGRVVADDRDIRTLPLASYRGHVGYVPQDGFIFTGTVRDNIAYGRHAATDAEVEAAARTVGAHDFIAQLPGGYREPLKGGGRSLSAGHRQLIALARPELIEPRILLLDEATAKLDLTEELRVAVGMRRASRNRTTVLLAHRLQTARSADRIVVMDHGRVAETGTHEDLLARGGRYAALWDVAQGVAG